MQSAIASVNAVLQLTSKVLASLNRVKFASKDCDRCIKGLGHIRNLLTNLGVRLEKEDAYQPWFSAVHALAVKNGPLDELKQALQDLESDLTMSGLMTNALFWKIERGEVNAVLASIERLKTLLEITLQTDHFKISQAIKDDIDSIEAHASAVQSTVNKAQHTSLSRSSRSAYEQQLSVAQSAAEKLAEVLWQNPGLQSLYVGLSHCLSQASFVIVHNDVLEAFFESIRTETENDQQRKAVRILRRPDHRERVANWIYKIAVSKLDPEALQKRRGFLDQRESRDEIMEGYLEYLKSQVEAGKHGQHNPLEIDLIDDEMEDVVSLEELSSIVTFFISGHHLETLRINLHGLMAPEAVIKEALRTGKVQVLEAILSKQLQRVAVGEYAWIKELDAAGYSQAEIAQLLIEEASDSPWIYFQPHYPEAKSFPMALSDFHVPGCVHGVKELDTGTKLRTELKEIDTGTKMRPELLRNDDFHSDVQELCGIAGVVPSSSDKSSWNGIVNFDSDNTGATVTYGLLDPSTANASRILLSRSVQKLNRLLAAIACLQNLDQCCEEYTVITLARPDDVVQMGVIKVGDLHSLLLHCQHLQKFPTVHLELPSSSFKTMLDICWQIFQVFELPISTLRRSDTVEAHLHVLTLTVQFASLAFLSYSQAHLAPLRPFFLDTPLERVSLCGSNKTSNFGINLAQVRLTCLNDMLHSPVTVFRFEEGFWLATPVGFGMASGLRHDLIASAGTLIDTWDGGNLIVPKLQRDRVENLSYFAIQMCGGVIAPVAPKRRARSGEKLFHWSSGSDPTTYEVLIPIEERIRIGAFVTINLNCAPEERLCWQSSTPAFEALGVQNNFWIHDETQVGGQAGQYALLQYNHTSHKIPGITLKTLFLRSIQNQPHLAREVLNTFWGVQVSFCTGVAQRVPLRMLMIDLMPKVAETMLEGKKKWNEINAGDRVIVAFQSDTTLEWIEKLDPPQSNFIDQLMCKILQVLAPTGIDEEGNELTVAWVYQRTPYRCFKVSCKERQNSWLRVLADSIDCATFAYIVIRCLETTQVKCRGPLPCWRSTAPILETAVLRHNLQPGQPLSPLEHKKIYFFRKMDTLLQVTVERQLANDPVRLYISPSSIPAKFRQRLYRMKTMQNQFSRIRERRESGEVGAENVAIFTKVQVAG
ncbi:hypothetical protein IQ07DRAFT_595009 [Pyrenochaeta sp. DS3sAY3a]|nr:hypothetical protein IQ07DRAFT_595009 [Pyrenochaeta sp. DS3sAY3a]